MRTRENQVEVIAHFSKEQREPIPLRVKLVERGETIVLRIESVLDIRYDSKTLLRYTCSYRVGNMRKTFQMYYFVDGMDWHIDHL